MEENVTRGLFNIDSINEASKGKVRSIDVDQLRENRLNSIYSQDDIDLLKENIEEFQLSQPLVVRKNDDSSYTILSGHRRFKACRKLFEEGKNLYFFDKEFVNQIPCVVDNRIYSNEDDEFLAIVSSNASRVLSSDERKAIYVRLKEIYDRKCTAGEKPKGREREIIASWMGVTDRTIQNYKTKTAPEKVQSQNNKGKIVKKLTSLEKYFTDIELGGYSQNDIDEIRQTAIPTINAVMEKLDIGTDEL